jgi:uncharacterized membrane protein YkvA (DUF1232 family)
MTTTDNRFYTRLRDTVTAVLPEGAAQAAGVVLAPADLAVLIGRAVISPHIPAPTKAYLILAGLYTSSGLDLLPEAVLGPIGLADDGVVILEALHRLLNQTDPAVIDALWPGEVSALRAIQRWTFEARKTVQIYVVRPVARWIRRAIASAIAGQEA